MQCGRGVHRCVMCIHYNISKQIQEQAHFGGSVSVRDAGSGVSNTINYGPSFMGWTMNRSSLPGMGMIPHHPQAHSLHIHETAAASIPIILRSLFHPLSLTAGPNGIQPIPSVVLAEKPPISSPVMAGTTPITSLTAEQANWINSLFGSSPSPSPASSG